MMQHVSVDALAGDGGYNAGEYERGNDIFDLLMAEVYGQTSGTLEDFIPRQRAAIAKLYHMGRMEGIRQERENSRVDG